MRTYYEPSPVQNLVVPAGGSKVFVIPYPTRVRLIRLNILQTSGSNVAFQADIYNHVVGDALQTSDYMWLITDYAGMQSDAAGIMVHHFPDFDVYFYNQDAVVWMTDPDQVSQSFNTPEQKQPARVVEQDIMGKRKLYLRITNKGGNDATFSAILGSEFLGD
jgi:hypothetical protein